MYTGLTFLFCLLVKKYSGNALMLHSQEKNTSKLKILSSYPLPPLHFHKMSFTRVKSGESKSKHTATRKKNIAEGREEIRRKRKGKQYYCPPTFFSSKF